MTVGAASESANSNVAEPTADIVAAYVSKNTVRAEDLASLISTVHSALIGVGQGTRASPQEQPTPPMPWKKAIKPDYIISFEDGKQYRSMKRHLGTRGLTPEQYRAKWGLPRTSRWSRPTTQRLAHRWPRQWALARRGRLLGRERVAARSRLLD